MRALDYPAWDELVVTDRPRPDVAADEVIVRVAACGICGSELETFASRSARRTPPLIMGHEFCGTVEAVGAEVSSWRTGERVVSNAVVPCGDCVRCQRGDANLCADRQVFGMHRMGAFAEFVAVPARCLIPWPENLPAEAACLAEPLANGIHVVELVKHRAPQTAVVIGAGPIGLMCQQALQVELDADVVVSDLVPERLAVARRLGSRQLVAPSELADAVRAWTDGEGVDLVVDAVGAEATKRQSLDVCRPGGAVVWVGLHGDAMTLDSYGVTLPEKTIYGTYAAHLHELATALEWMAAGRVDVRSWVQAFPLADGADAFHRMLAAQGDDLKAVLLPQ
ncbi:MAG: galactitol-1-phosphate 5-dehydrogenase [Rubricoccaceae bacterium]